jgi:hypothetical protein
LEEVGVGLGTIDWKTVMHLVVGVEARKTDFCSETETWDQLVSIIVKYYVAYLMYGLFVLTLFGRSVVVMGSGIGLYAVT